MMFYATFTLGPVLTILHCVFLYSWEQNIDLGEVNIYKDNDNTTDEFCVARAGFAEFVLTPEVLPAYEELSTCVDTCSDPEDCVVITGHSQGAASSIILSILIYSLTPTVVTFGMPPALKEGCAFVHSDRFYRFVNFRQEDDEFDDIGFDPVPFSPTFISGSVHYGHYILVGPDKTAAKYLGFDQNYTFEVDFSDRQNEIASHTMNGTDYSYAARVANLLNSTSFPVSTDGFSDGTVCETQYREICASGTCRNFSCAQPLSELCVEGSCEDDSDCESGVCIWDACASADGEVAGGCPCRDNSNCKSGDCDTSVTGLDWVCEYAPGEATSTPGEATSAGDHAFYGKTFSVGAMLGILFSFM